MPVAVAEAVGGGAYGRFPEHLERDWLGRWCHLSEADVSLVRRRAEQTTRLGFAAQLVTVRAIGTFLADPTAVPAPIVTALARQLDIGDRGLLTGYGKLAVRWKHTAEIRGLYGYTDFTSGPATGRCCAGSTGRPGPTTSAPRCCSGPRTAGCWRNGSCCPARTS